MINKFIKAIEFKILQKFPAAENLQDIRIEDLMGNYGYLRIIDNWHKHPVMSKIMCKLGRHDYECSEIIGEYASLYCFYCDKTKHSHILTIFK